MLIRPCRPEDEEAVVALWDACGLLRPWNDPHKDIRRKVADGAEGFLVGEIEGRVVATAMTGYGGHRGWVNYLAVSPALQRRGLGRAIMAEAERWLPARGCPKINLMVRTGNEAAIAFCRALGFAADDVACLGRRLESDLPPAPGSGPG